MHQIVIMNTITYLSSVESEYIHGNNGVSLVVFRKGAQMSSKVDTLLQKATAFEKIALYGDRKAYFRALAQSAAQESHTASAALDNAVKQLNSALQQFISGPAEVQTDLPGRTKGLPPAMRASAEVVRQVSQAGANAQNAQQLYNAARQLANLRNVGNMNMDAKNVWLNTVTAAASTVMDVYSKQWLPMVGQQAAPPAEEGSGVLQLPETVVPGKAPAPAYDHGTVVTLQTFLNNALKGRITPLITDGKLGNLTVTALKQWAKANGLSETDVKSLVNIALQAA
jgi:hypothetical protein